MPDPASQPGAVVADLRALTTRLGARLATARREIDAIDALLVRLGGVPTAARVPGPPELERAPAAPARPATVSTDVRTRAITLALDGADRAHARSRLALELSGPELEAVLDDVFGPA